MHRLHLAFYATGVLENVRTQPEFLKIISQDHIPKAHGYIVSYFSLFDCDKDKMPLKALPLL
jgi:hypothetical protein